MKKSTTKIIIALMTCTSGIVGALLGNNYNKQNQEQYIESQIANVNGNNNTVNINDVKDLVDEYNKIQSINESLTAQNTEYFQKMTEFGEQIKLLETNSNSELEKLKEQLNDAPNVQFRNIGLSIDGEEKVINKTNSSVIIDNRTYYADEIINNLISDKQNLTIKDGTMYIGKIIKDKSYLSDEWEVDSNNVKLRDSINDSYGNPYTNALYFATGNCYIIYNLNRNFSLMKFKVSIAEYSQINRNGVITIKADDNIVYTSPSLNKLSEPFEVIDVPINNCSLLNIEYHSPDGSIYCIISDVIVYN